MSTVRSSARSAARSAARSGVTRSQLGAEDHYLKLQEGQACLNTAESRLKDRERNLEQRLEVVGDKEKSLKERQARVEELAAKGGMLPSGSRASASRRSGLSRRSGRSGSYRTATRASQSRRTAGSATGTQLREEVEMEKRRLVEKAAALKAREQNVLQLSQDVDQMQEMMGPNQMRAGSSVGGYGARQSARQSRRGGAPVYGGGGGGGQMQGGYGGQQMGGGFAAPQMAPPPIAPMAPMGGGGGYAKRSLNCSPSEVGRAQRHEQRLRGYRSPPPQAYTPAPMPPPPAPRSVVRREGLRAQIQTFKQDIGNMRMSPPMAAPARPSYPPSCSLEQRLEQVGKFLGGGGGGGYGGGGSRAPSARAPSARGSRYGGGGGGTGMNVGGKIRLCQGSDAGLKLDFEGDIQPID